MLPFLPSWLRLMVRLWGELENRWPALANMSYYALVVRLMVALAERTLPVYLGFLARLVLRLVS